MSRVRVYDAEELAVGMTEKFHDRPWEHRDELPFTWPQYMQNVGDSLAVAYASDKWKKKNGGRRERELYKHLAESRNQALVKPGLLVDYYRPNKSWDVCGPVVTLQPCPMPRHFAILGLCEEVDLQLYSAGSAKKPKFGPDDEVGIVKVTIRHGIVGGGIMQFSKGGNQGKCKLAMGGKKDQPFLFVYTETQGIQMIVVGDELDVEKDGIAG
jgi:hypothetical protein